MKYGNKKSILLAAGALLLISTVAATVVMVLGGDSQDNQSIAGLEIDPSIDTTHDRGWIPTSIKKEQGPRPDSTRLRDGNVQAMNKAAGIASAEKALDRVEKEIAQATSAEDRARLTHKKALIMRALER